MAGGGGRVGAGWGGMRGGDRRAVLSSVLEDLWEKHAGTHNPVKGVKRPAVEGYDGKTPALGDHQARKLRDAPDNVSLKGKRDRAMLATLLYHAQRREELCNLKVKDFRHEGYPTSRAVTSASRGSCWPGH